MFTLTVQAQTHVPGSLSLKISIMSEFANGI